jgi:hypothetical protein
MFSQVNALIFLKVIIRKLNDVCPYHMVFGITFYFPFNYFLILSSKLRRLSSIGNGKQMWSPNVVNDCISEVVN